MITTQVRASFIVRFIRLLEGLTQTEMAKELGIAQSTLCRIEDEKLEPSAEQWLFICKQGVINPQALINDKIFKNAVQLLLNRSYRKYPRTTIWRVDHTPHAIRQMRTRGQLLLAPNSGEELYDKLKVNNEYITQSQIGTTLGL